MAVYCLYAYLYSYICASAPNYLVSYGNLFLVFLSCKYLAVPDVAKVANNNDPSTLFIYIKDLKKYISYFKYPFISICFNISFFHFISEFIIKIIGYLKLRNYFRSLHIYLIRNKFIYHLVNRQLRVRGSILNNRNYFLFYFFLYIFNLISYLDNQDFLLFTVVF